MNNYTNPVTVTGNPASFEASGNGKLLSLSVPFSPIQDLHGYSSPWPAGGGVNKFDISFYNIGFPWTNVSGVITNAGTPLSSSYNGCGLNGRGTTTLLAGTYTLSLKARLVSGEYTAGKFNALRLHTNGANMKDFQKVSNPMISNEFQLYYGTLTLEESYTFEDINLQFSTGLSNAVFEIKEIQIELGSTATSFAPYSNICPITGRTGVNVYRTGKNGLNLDTSVTVLTGSVPSSVTIVSGVGSATITEEYYNRNSNKFGWEFGAKENEEYTISGKVQSSGTVIFKIYSASGDVVLTFNTPAREGTFSQTFNSGPNTKLYFYASISSWGQTISLTDIQIELGSTATTYESYRGNTYAVDWTSEAGTVYGGTLDVVTGVLTVDRATVTLNGSETWGAGFPISEQGCYTALHSLKKLTGYKSAISCNELKTYDGYTAREYRDAEYGISGYQDWLNIYPGQNWLYIKINGLSTKDEYKTWLASNNLQVVYTLATPLTYQLTPTQVELLIGQNNVWSDSNEAVTLTYVIELFTRYTFIVNGNDYTGLVERDSYRTAVTPVYGETIQTLDGVGHTALLRVKGSLTVKLNPQTAAQTAAICADLLNAPCEVQYKCLQRNVNVTALMVLDAVSAMFLSRCLYLGQKWNDVDEIVLKEL